MRVKKQVLFLGGPVDGERKDIESELSWVKFCERPSVNFRAITEDPHELLEVTDHVYKFEKISGNLRRFTVAVHEDLTPDDMMEMLIENYKRPDNYKEMWEALMLNLQVRSLFRQNASAEDNQQVVNYRTVIATMKKLEQETKA